MDSAVVVVVFFFFFSVLFFVLIRCDSERVKKWDKREKRLSIWFQLIFERMMVHTTQSNHFAPVHAYAERAECLCKLTANRKPNIFRIIAITHHDEFIEIERANFIWSRIHEMYVRQWSQQSVVSSCESAAKIEIEILNWTKGNNNNKISCNGCNLWWIRHKESIVCGRWKWLRYCDR